MSNFKLQLNEDEKDTWNEVMHNSDAYKIIFKVLDQLSATREQALLSRYVDGSDKSKNDLMCDMITIQGYKKLISDFKALRAPSKK